MFSQAYDGVSEFVSKHKLTHREGEIFCLIALKGYSNQQIAAHCMISEKTVKNHIVNIMNKIGARTIRKLLSLMISEMALN
jgi:DNA-binding NarL/FixJ family response regulator